MSEITQIRLSDLEANCIAAWKGCDPDYGYFSFAGIASRTKTPRHLVRRVVRSLARKGLLQFAKGLWDDEGAMRGSGYGRTKVGEVWLSAHPDTLTDEAKLRRSQALDELGALDGELI